MDSRARIPVETVEEFDEWFWNARPMERPGDTEDQRPSALQADAPPQSSSGHSIDHAPPPIVTYTLWYRHRAEELGDLAGEMIAEGLDGTAYGATRRAAHYGRIALELYEQRRREWLVTNHPSNFL